METYTQPKLVIKSWAEEDRPREKMLLKGKHSLSNAELLAILLGSGSREETAVGLAQRILRTVGNDLNELGKCSIADLSGRYKGVGEAKAITIAAAMELGRRRQLSSIQEKPQICSSRDSYDAIAPLLMDLHHEEFWILVLNRANRLLGRQQISRGGVAGTVVDAKVVFRKALETAPQACSVVLCHNHPSGNLYPSQADLELTLKLRQAGQVLDMQVIDHLIISQAGYYSFADDGKMGD
jgi:DNA repair protein RadC